MSALCRSFACASKGCQNVIHLHHDTERKLRSTHETFYCPAGHSNYFPGATDEEKRIGRLERAVDRWQELYDEMLESREEWKLQAKRCPFGCGFRVQRKSKPESIEWMLQSHLVEVHGAVFPTTEERGAGLRLGTR